MKKITIKNILARKNRKPITCLTAYSKVTAEILDKYCDIILVGDSVGMSMYGMKTTKEVKIDTMILHGRSVKKFAKRSLIVFDMPYKTYTNKIIAYKNAKKALEWGLINEAVPFNQLEQETVKWSQEILKKSPLSIRMLKGAMNADCDGQAGLQQFAGDATMLFYMSEEAQEGRDAFKEKREPNFKKFPKLP